MGDSMSAYWAQWDYDDVSSMHGMEEEEEIDLDDIPINLDLLSTPGQGVEENLTYGDF